MANRIERESNTRVEVTEIEHGTEDNYYDNVSNTDEGFIYNNGKHRPIHGCIKVDEFQDGNGGWHTLASFPVVSSGRNKKKRRRTQACNTCGKQTTWFCIECNKLYFKQGLKKSKDHGRTCYTKHICNWFSNRTVGI